MNDDTFNHSIRKLLKNVGVNTQQEIEQAVREALADGRLTGNETLPARVRVEVAGLELDLEFRGDITLE
ncbi:DUF6494 family protein [Halomonas saccharevitans]|uniref:DUF6494 family protein n=1 Tax=Halomonas saccharevitans TaxID=416872 RepID=A0A1I7BMK5_9GAMM|nr:DUF6494 family protein [Halomonas saccharevitans]MDT8880523.1 DUF6494 family protein [Halomonas saccharevitans]SFT88418.1 hypothetical protein SAMN04487956_1287 [Halomonas saccharevitans]